MSRKDPDIAEIISKVNGVDIELPDLVPDEPPLTQEQFKEIQKLSDNILPDEKVLGLGKWQAAHVIYKLKEGELMEGMAEIDKYDNKIKMLKSALVLAVLFFFALLIISLLLKAFKH